MSRRLLAYCGDYNCGEQRRTPFKFLFSNGSSVRARCFYSLISLHSRSRAFSYFRPRPSGVLFYRRGIGYCIPFLFEMTMMAIEERLYCSSSRRASAGQAASLPPPSSSRIICNCPSPNWSGWESETETVDCRSGQNVCEQV